MEAMLSIIWSRTQKRERGVKRGPERERELHQPAQARSLTSKHCLVLSTLRDRKDKEVKH